MRKLPRTTADKVISLLKKNGFSLVRQSKSLKIYRNSENIRVTVPYHSGEISHPKIIRQILTDVELNPEDL